MEMCRIVGVQCVVRKEGFRIPLSIVIMTVLELCRIGRFECAAPTFSKGYPQTFSSVAVQHPPDQQLGHFCNWNFTA